MKMKVNRFFTTCLAFFATLSLFAQKLIILQPGMGGPGEDPIIWVVDDCYDLEIEIIKIQIPNNNTIKYKYRVTNIGKIAVDVRRIVVQAQLLKHNQFGATRTPAGGRILAKNHLILEPGEGVTQTFQSTVRVNPSLQDFFELKVDPKNEGADCNILNNVDRIEIPVLITDSKTGETPRNFTPGRN